MDRDEGLNEQEMKALQEKKAAERTPAPRKTALVGWTDDHVDAIGDRWAKLESAASALERHAGVKLRLHSVVEGRARLGIVDAVGRWLPQEQGGREWAIAFEQLQAAKLTLTDEGELVDFTPPAKAEAPKGRRGRGAAAEG